MDHWARSYARTLNANRWPLIIFTLYVSALIGGAGLFLSFDPDARVYFGRHTPERAALAAFEERHGRTRSAVFVVNPALNSVLDERPLKGMIELSNEIRKVAGVDTVKSIVDLPIFAAPGAPAPPVSLAALGNVTSQSVSTLSAYVERNRDLVAPLLSPGNGVAAIVVTLAPKSGDTKALNAIVDDLKGLKERFVTAHPEISVLLTGSAVQDAAFIDAILSDMATLVPAQTIAMILLLIVGLQSISAAIALLLVLGAATALMMGVASWAGMTLNGVTSAAPTVLMGLAIASGMHIVLTWQQSLRDTNSRLKAMQKTLRLNAAPVFLAIVTTVLSFLCLNFSDSPPFRQFGTLVALGLTATLFFTFTLLPALLLVLPANPAPGRARLEEYLARLGARVATLRTPLLIIFALASIALGVGTTRIVFSDNFAHYFDTRFEFRRATDLYEKKISGILTVEFSIPASPGKSVLDPDYLRDLDAFSDWLKGEDVVTRVDSLAALVKRIAATVPGLAGKDALPSSPAMIESLLASYRTAGGAKDIDALVNSARDHSRLTVTLANISSNRLLAFAQGAEDKLAAINAQRAAPATGIAILAAHLAGRNTKAMVAGTAVALAIISLILVFTLGNLAHGVISLVPNLFPLLAAYGLWGLVFQEVSFAATVVSAMTFGIVVDDTVHFIMKYRLIGAKRGSSGPQIVAESFRTVGLAVILTSISIAVGFIALAFSGFLVNQHLGLMTLITLVAALLACLFFLPPLLLLADRRNHTQRNHRLQHRPRA